MSQENVDLVQGALAQFTADQTTLSDAMADDFVWDMRGFRGWPDEPMYHGREGFLEFFKTWTAPFDEWSQEVERVDDLGGDEVLCRIRQHAQLRGSEARVEMRYGVVYTVSGGQIRWARVYATPEEALEAVGLAE